MLFKDNSTAMWRTNLKTSKRAWSKNKWKLDHNGMAQKANGRQQRSWEPLLTASTNCISSPFGEQVCLVTHQGEAFMGSDMNKAPYWISIRSSFIQNIRLKAIPHYMTWQLSEFRLFWSFDGRLRMPRTGCISLVKSRFFLTNVNFTYRAKVNLVKIGPN